MAERMTEWEVLQLERDVISCFHRHVSHAEAMRLIATAKECWRERADRLCPSCRVEMCERCAATHECLRADIEKLEKVDAPPPA